MTRSTTRDARPWTCRLAQVEHKVTDADFAAWHNREVENLRAVCGEYIAPQTGDQPSGRPCRMCRRLLAAPVVHDNPSPLKVDVAEILQRPDVAVPRQDRGSHRRRGPWYRLTHGPTCQVAVADVLAAAAEPAAPAPADGAAVPAPRAQATPDAPAGAERAA